MRKLKAMVIEDSVLMRRAVIKTLKETGMAEFDFTEATDGIDALQKLAGQSFDVLFVDWNMSRMTGIDLVRTVRRQEKGDQIRIVMVTSERQPSKIKEALEDAGADVYITKPFSVQDFMDKVAPILVA
jgi:two-component system, chemotaxis family, chemotaxis protein CheY